MDHLVREQLLLSRWRVLRLRVLVPAARIVTDWGVSRCVGENPFAFEIQWFTPLSLPTSF